MRHVVGRNEILCVKSGANADQKERVCFTEVAYCAMDENRAVACQAF